MEKKKIDRRKFLKTFGVGAAAATAGLYGCKTKGTAPSAAAAGEVPTDRMTFRTCPSTGDRVSLLGYGCMRWPLLESPAADGNPIDQEAVNELVDYAIAHGVNYFDTAPVYIQGFSEKSTGIALKRHPREKVFIATKMSNFSNFTRENSLAMYRRSMAELQVDYLDYYLLHSVGGGKGVETFNERFIDNGVLDFLLREREAGRIRNLGWSFHGDRKVFDHLLAMHDRGEAVWDFVQIQTSRRALPLHRHLHPGSFSLHRTQCWGQTRSVEVGFERVGSIIQVANDLDGRLVGCGFPAARGSIDFARCRGVWRRGRQAACVGAGSGGNGTGTVRNAGDGDLPGDAAAGAEQPGGNAPRPGAAALHRLGGRHTAGRTGGALRGAYHERPAGACPGKLRRAHRAADC